MQLSNEIFFTKERLKQLYGEHSKMTFCDAIDALIKKSLLNAEEYELLQIITSDISYYPEFLRKSFFIYLSNGILLETDKNTLFKIKNQILFELAIRYLECSLGTKVNYFNEDKNLFSVCLNKSAGMKFYSVGKEDDKYVFYNGEDAVLRLRKNGSCAIDRDIDFLEDDRNPFNVNNDHPDAENFSAYDLGGIAKERWVEQFRDAYGLIKKNVPEIYEDIYYFLDAIVPHGYVKGKQNSSSYSKSPGILYLSYTDSDAIQAEAIIHEAHHTIFNIINWKHGLLDNDMTLKYYSAYRPDARHMKGCLIGLHAFAAVQNFYCKLLENDHKFVEKFFFSYLKNEKAIGVIEKYADFTETGRLLFQDIKIKHYNDQAEFESLKKEHSEIYAKMENTVNGHLEEAIKKNKVLLH